MQDHRFASFSYEFRHERRAEPDRARLRHPFCSLQHVQSDYASYQRWVFNANLLEMKLKGDMVRIMSHSLWPQYLKHIETQGAELCDFASLDAIMAGDAQATLEDWDSFIDGVQWIKQDHMFFN